MNKATAVSILSLVLGMGISGTICSTKVKSLNSRLKHKDKELALLTREVEKKIDKVSLTQWIYSNSKIPLSYCKEISQALSSCNHPLLLASLIRRESSFNPTARSKSGALGLGQVMPKVWLKELKEKKIVNEKRDLLGIKENIKATNYIFEKLLQQKKGNVSKALFAYVGSQGRSDYVRDILTTYAQMKFNKMIK